MLSVGALFSAPLVSCQKGGRRERLTRSPAREHQHSGGHAGGGTAVHERHSGQQGSGGSIVSNGSSGSSGTGVSKASADEYIASATHLCSYRNELAVLRVALTHNGSSETQLTSSAATSANLLGLLASGPGQPSVVHFIGTGIREGGLLLETDKGFSHCLPTEHLVCVRSSSPPVIFLSANGQPRAEEACAAFLAAGAPAVITLFNRNLAFVHAFYHGAITQGQDADLGQLFHAALLEAPGVEAEIAFGEGFSAKQQLKLRNFAAKVEGASTGLSGVPHKFFARASECRRLCTAFRSSETHGVAIMGRSGCGKSCLALHATEFAFERNILRCVYYADARRISIDFAKKKHQRAARLSHLVLTLSSAFNQVPGIKFLTQFLSELANMVEPNSSEKGGKEETDVNAKLFNHLCALIDTKRDFEVISKLVQSIHSVIGNAARAAKSVLFLDSCEVLAAVDSVLFVSLVNQLAKHLSLNVLICTATPVPGLKGFETICLNDLDPFHSLSLVNAVLGREEVAAKDVISELACLGECSPSTMLDLVDMLKQQQGVLPLGSALEQLQNKSDARTLQRLGELLALFLDSASLVAQGLEFFDKCMSRTRQLQTDTRHLPRETPGCPPHAPPQSPKSRYAWSAVSGQAFRDQLVLTFASCLPAIAKERPLSPQTAHSVAFKLTAVSPFFVHAGKQQRHASAEHFAARFWPWWCGMVWTVPRLGKDVWTRRLSGGLPLVWIDTRHGATERIASQPPGVFTLRFSESTTHAVAIEYVDSARQRRSLLAMVLNDGAVRVAKDTYKSIISMILSRAELGSVFGIPANCEKRALLAPAATIPCK